ncbi:hypothetical protein [Campylobacter sp. CCUG 57310]|uniref:hypothetical protein n=1 Tax=Campylobacter sp. CCUG 57310 TaxID=2517362 RepID=UPI0015671611|nr:hypothetical protein [Campylobacter sp. CCUG 57310]QKF91464.1 hypothetical protein CORI_0229 [Campylobacter sp. CCUG 57310]
MQKTNFNRFRAYLRYKFKGQKKSSNYKQYLYIFIYILISLTVFLIPNDILDRYSLAKHFTNFMEFIPAIEQIEHRSAIPQIAKFYTAYMFIVGIVFAMFFMYNFFVYSIHHCRLFDIYKKERYIPRIKPKTSLFMFIAFAVGIFWFFYMIIQGNLIGIRPKQAIKSTTIDDIYGLLFYVDSYYLMTFGCIAIVVVAIVIIIDILFLTRIKK